MSFEDVEKTGSDALYSKEPYNTDISSFEQTGEVEGKKDGYIQRMSDLALSMGAEVRGIERVMPEDQNDDSIWNVASMWFGANMVIATVSIGVLGVTLFDLDFWTSFLVIIFFNILGSQTVALFSTFGPIFGLRQMVITKFWFGPYFSKVPAIINIFSCIGFTAVNTIVSAQLLHTVNGGSLPPWAGILIIIACTFVLSFFGYHIVHVFEKWSWVPNVIIFIIVAVQMGRSHTFTAGTMTSGATTAGNVLSFGGTIYGFATGWTSYAADYTVYMKPSTPKWKIYLAVLVGLNTPLIVCMILGAACATGTLTNSAWLANYNANSVGGLFYSILVDDSLHGFGQFCLVILALSTISNNIPNLYSLALSTQTLWDKLIIVPRFIWTFVGAAVSLAIAIPAYYDFANVMSDLMDLIGYWLAAYSAVGISEHYFFKRGFKGYDVDDYENDKIHPPGIAAGLAFLLGIMGAVFGMDQAWYIGIIARKIGAYGGDVGFELAFSFAFISHLALRPIEKRYFKR